MSYLIAVMIAVGAAATSPEFVEACCECCKAMADCCCD